MKSLLTASLIFCYCMLSAQHVPENSASTVGRTFQSGMDFLQNGRDHICAGDVARTQIMGRYPHLLSRENEMNEGIRSSQNAIGGNREDVDQYISVVVHIIHQNGDENISDAQVIQGIDDLNDAFSNTGAYASVDGVDSHIRFCFAQQDPFGLPTTGITRDFNSLTSVVMESNDIPLKDINRWDPLKFLNIWLVAEISSIGMGSGVAGYAYLPYSHGLPEDGIVNEARWFGSNTNFSKVHIHEVGHYFGLYHTFEGGCNNDDCTMNGDLVCDTPPDASTDFSPCSIVQNSCSTDEDDTTPNNPFRAIGLGGLGEQNDLVENYMDYSDQGCQTLFTEGQSIRMSAALENERATLLNSGGCISSCGIGPVEILGENTQFLAGESVNIAQASFALVDVDYEWTFLGDLLATTAYLQYTFTNSQIGEGFLYFTITNTELGCSRQDSVYIQIECNPPASFIMSPQYAEVNEMVTFNGSNVLANSYQWFLDGNLVSQNSILNYTFDTAEAHHIYLVTGNGFCTDTSEIEYFAVGSCVGGQNNRWIIGGIAGIEIDFTSGTPVATNVPSVENNYLMSGEGLATISDQNGDLLFYTDGNTIFNRNYQPFYTGLGAAWSSSQGAMIVPDPANDHEYYVFTTENFAGYGPGSYYTGWGFAYIKVDMNLNGGLGGASSNYTQLLAQTTEKQTCVRHCNGHDIWVICHGYHNNWYYSYLITDEGISNPVISAVGVTIDDVYGVAGIGCLKASPQGNMIIAGHDYLGQTEFFHFDNNTGELLDDFGLLNNSWFYGAYGVAFSPDGSKAYYVNEYDANIHQIDLSSGDQQIILNSRMVIGVSSRPYYMGAMELGPDAKIYIAQSSGTYLDVIHYPNEAGLACGFEGNGFELPGVAFYGINNILSNSREASTPQITGVTQVCGNVSNVHYTSTCGNNEWSFVGPGILNLISESEVSIDFNSSGTAMLICSKYDDCFGMLSDTLMINVGSTAISLGSDISICSTGSVMLNAPGQFQSYIWSNGANTQNITVQNSGNYWVAATALGGCIARDTINVSVFNEPFEVESQNVEVCNGSPSYVYIPATLGDFTHHWYTPDGTVNENLQAILYPEFYNGPWQFPIYYVNDHGCVDLDTIFATLRADLPEFELSDIVLCPGEIQVIELDPDIHCLYTWQDGSHQNPYTIYSPQNSWFVSFYVTRFDSLCSTYESTDFYVYTPLVEHLLLNDTIRMCEGSQIELYAGWAFDNYEWQDGSIDTTLLVTESGTYWVNTSTPCGIYTDTTEVIYYNTSQYQIELQDTIQICSAQLPFQLQYYNPNLYSYNWSNGSGVVFEEGEISLFALNFCGAVYDTTYIAVSPSPVNLIPPDIYECDSSFVHLVQPADQETIWNNNEIADSILVTQDGVYYYTTSIGNSCSIADSVTVVISNLYFYISDTSLCPGDTLHIIPETNADYWQWVIAGFPSTVTIIDTGTYNFIAGDKYCTQLHSINVEFSNNNYSLVLPDSISACSEQLPFSVTASGDEALLYDWSNGSSTSSIEVIDGGWYTLQATYECGQKTDSTFFQVLESPLILLPFDTTLCSDSQIVFTASNEYENHWSNGENANSIVINEAGIYTLTSISSEGCLAFGSTEVIASDLFITLDSEAYLCQGDSVLLTATSNGISNQWNTGNMNSSIYASAEGTYTFYTELENCSASESVSVYQLPSTSFSLGNDTLVISDHFTINGPEGFDSYVWNVPSENTHTLDIQNSGTYVLTVIDEHGCDFTDEMVVVFDVQSTDSYIDVPDFFFYGNGDLIAKYQNVVVYDVKIFDAIGKLVSYGNTFPMIWDGKVNGNEASSSMYYYIINYSDLSGYKKVKNGKTLLVK